MAFWNDSRGLDDLVRAGDRTLNVLVIVLLAAFALDLVLTIMGR